MRSSYSSRPGSTSLHQTGVGEGAGGAGGGCGAALSRVLRCLLRSRRARGPARRRLNPLSEGILLGFTLATLTCACAGGLLLLAWTAPSPGRLLWVVRRALSVVEAARPPPDPAGAGAAAGDEGGMSSRGGRLYVGVMTAPRSAGRAEAIRDTWSKGVSHVTFYTLEERAADGGPVGFHGGVEVVQLNGGTRNPRPDGYLMTFDVIRHICMLPTIVVEKFDWFMTSYDDVYVNVKKLTSMIRSLKSTSSSKIHAGLATSHKMRRPGLSICTSSPAILLSRQLLQETCGYLDRCEREAQQYKRHLALSSCVYHYTGVQCTPLPQTAFHEASDSDLMTLVQGAHVTDQGGHVADVSEQVAEATFLHGVPQPWMLHQLHALNTAARFTARGQSLEKLLEARRTLEDLLYAPYPGVPGVSSSSAQVVHTVEGWSFSSRTCRGTSRPNPRQRQLVEDAAFIIRASQSVRMPQSAQLQALQVYTSTSNATTDGASLVDMRIEVSSHQHNLTTLSRVALTAHHRPLRQLSMRTFNKLDHLWILLPVSHIAAFLSYLEFWTRIREVKLGFALTLIVIPVNLNGAQLSRAIPEQGIYNSNGEIRRLVTSPKEPSSLDGALSSGLAHACAGRLEAGVLMTSLDARFNAAFLARCLGLASAGRHYMPTGYQEKILSQEQMDTLSEGSDNLSDAVGDGSGNHTVWLESEQHTVRCISTKYCEDLRLTGKNSNSSDIRERIIEASDPDLFWVPADR